MKNDIVIAINNILTSKKGAKYAQLSEIYKEVARIMEKTVIQIKTLAVNARKRLKQICKEEVGVNEG